MIHPTLFLMLGYPGAGKTTIAKIIEELTGAVRLTSDEIRLQLFPNPTFSDEEHAKLYQEIDRQTEMLLSSGKNVIYDANLNRKVHRQEKYDICKKTGAKPVLIWVRTDKTTSKDRAIHKNRFRLWPRHETPIEMFDRISDAIEKPDAKESPVEIIGENISKEKVSILLEDLGWAKGNRNS